MNIEHFYAQNAVLSQPLMAVGLNGSGLRQARLCYLSFYCRTGGVNWPLLKQNYDGVIIRAGQGYWGYDELLHEHVDKAVEHGVPYMTSWQADPRQNVERQTEFYLDGYGVLGHRMSIAFENTGGGIVTPAQGFMMMVKAKNIAGEKPLGYSRQNIIFGDWNYPDWIDDYQWEIARYPYTFTGNVQYSTCEQFENERGWTFPKDLSPDFEENCEMWQFSEKIDARATFANARTADPKYTAGLLSGTASMSTIMAVDEFVEWMGGTQELPPPVEDPELAQRVQALEDWRVEVDKDLSTAYDLITELQARVDALEHTQPAPPEPVDYALARVIDSTPAFAASGYNAAKRPIINVNAYQATNDPALKFAYGAVVKIKPEIVDADGEIDYFELVDVPLHNYPVLYVRADKVIKL